MWKLRWPDKMVLLERWMPPSWHVVKVMRGEPSILFSMNLLWRGVFFGFMMYGGFEESVVTVGKFNIL